MPQEHIYKKSLNTEIQKTVFDSEKKPWWFKQRFFVAKIRRHFYLLKKLYKKW
jgi:phosphorylcholine metabolism protein LicD